MSKKIVINGRFTVQVQTGVQRYAHEVTNRLQDRVEVFAPRASLKGVWGHAWEQFALPAMLSAGDLLWSPANLGPILWGNQVLSVYDVSPLEHPEWYPRSFAGYYRSLWPQLVKRVQKIITASEFSKSRIVQMLDVPEEKIAVIPGGVSDEFAPQPPDTIVAVRQKFALPQNHVLFVGASQPRKNLATLLQAWEIAASQLHDTALVVVGRINPSRIPSASDGSPGKVRFIGYVEDSDLAALYSGAKLFVYPSLYEGFGLPVLEAMTCGAPAITSRRASLPEVAGGEAFYVDPENIGEMADAILELLSDEDRRQSLIQSGFAQARKFSWQAAAEAHWDLFVSLLENDG